MNQTNLNQEWINLAPAWIKESRDGANPTRNGLLDPPMLASYRFNKPMIEVMRAVLPMLGVQFIGVLLITYVPPLTTWLPHLLSK